MKNLITLLLFVFAGLAVQAQEKKNTNAKYTFEVSGNCDQCQKRIQKAAFSVSGVKSAFWDVQTQQLKVILNEKKCEVADVKKAIAKAGHDSGEVKATDEDYANLHHCCKYDRK